MTHKNWCYSLVIAGAVLVTTNSSCKKDQLDNSKILATLTTSSPDNSMSLKDVKPELSIGHPFTVIGDVTNDGGAMPPPALEQHTVI